MKHLSAREKAKDLYDKYCHHTYAGTDAKDCSVLCVEEIINSLITSDEDADIMFSLEIKYYTYVKEEILKL